MFHWNVKNKSEQGGGKKSTCRGGIRETGIPEKYSRWNTLGTKKKGEEEGKEGKIPLKNQVTKAREPRGGKRGGKGKGEVEGTARPTLSE